MIPNRTEGYISEQLKKRRSHRLWQRIVSAMICVVVFCTTYALILPAITQESDVFCGYEEHIHTDNCYKKLDPVLLCEKAEFEAHAHTEECYETAQPLVCGLEESEGHIHSGECFCETVVTLTCEIEQSEGHAHTDACLDENGEQICGLVESEGHTHAGDCFITEGGELICDAEESEGHVHSDACLGEAVQMLACEIAETEGHAHSDNCYQISEELACGLDAHTHQLSCYADTTADVETAADWEQTFSGAELTGTWTQDLLTIANTQLGYTESTKNFIVLEDGTTKGYTRYGAWYGDPYGDWCAMFVSFCLHYAGVENIPLDSNCQNWIEALENAALYRLSGSYDPQIGNLVFFDRDYDGSADHVGIVSGRTDSTETTAGEITAIEGNSGNQVRMATYSMSDQQILGYAELPWQPTPAEQAQIDSVISQIDQMPSADEIDGKLLEYEEAEDYEGEEAYYTEVCQEVARVYYAYCQLSEELQALVTNAGKLLELEYIWSVTTLDLLDTITVYQVNQYDGSSTNTVLVSGGTVETVIGSTMDFLWWTAVIVEEGDGGQLYVSQIIPAGEIKKFSYGAETESGFVLLVHSSTGAVGVQLGDPVTVGFSYQKSAYSSSGLGTVNFGTTLKPEKDNTAQLDIVQSADTLELIEVNLYDFNSSINDLYKTNTKYPGFQQDNGTTSIGSSLGATSFNFGNNITSDLAAGIESLTNKGGDINKTASTYGGVNYGIANIPLENVILKTLQDGYPALADGTSLGYLFSNSDYATKQNSANINGLFRYNATTGAYTFNSRENHAQFDADTNTFTLYKQIISSNFIMYPFGNFLPFNDITQQSTQASSIDRSYFVTLARSAMYRYNQGAGSEYYTLSTQLTNFIARMDAKYGTSWDSCDAVNAYFAASGLTSSFDETSPTLDGAGLLMDYVYSIDYDEATDFFFAMEMKMNFIQPKDGLTGLTGKEEMVFYFTGDDDVWIYLDGVLFLDLSGIHRHVGGKIDFVNGMIYYYSLDVATGDVATTPYKTVTFEEAFREAYPADSTELTAALASLNEKGTFKDYSTHSFNFYYIERGAGSGVCRMNFNFPLVRQNTLSLEKALTDDSDSVTPLGNPDFMFQILDADDNSLFLPENWAYSLYDTDGSVIQKISVKSKYPDGRVKEMTIEDSAGNVLCTETYDSSSNLTSRTGTGLDQVIRIGENGIFTLKAGQQAEFVGIPETWGQYYVRELLELSDASQYGTITVSGTAVTPETVDVGGVKYSGVDSPVLDMSHGSSSFRVENKITTAQLGKLSITKVLAGSDTDKTFDMEVTLDGELLPVGTEYTVGTETRSVETEGIITLAPGKTATISNIISGTKFTVKETNGTGYTVSYEASGSGDHGITQIDGGISGVVRTGSTVAVTVTNSEQGAEVEIPVTKTVANPDGNARDFTFILTQVADQNGTALEGATPQTVTLSTTDSSAGAFRLSYLKQNFSNGETKLYYKITESQADGTAENTQVFIAEVTVTTSDANFTAELTNMWLNTGQDGAFESHESKSADFVNTLAGSLSLSKIVSGSTPEGGFSFTITLSPAVSDQVSYPAKVYDADGNIVRQNEIVFTDGATVVNEVRSGETISISGLPVGTQWTITETTTDGYIVSYTVNGESCEGATSGGSIILGDTKVVCTNTQTYVLPETGGAGTTTYTLAGLMLMLCGTAYLLYRLKKRRREAY